MKLAALCLLLIAPLAGALDFTPIEIEGNGEAGKYTYLEFHDGRKRITYMPPRRWVVTGAGSLLKLTPPAATQADVDLEAQSIKEPLPIPGTALEAFEEIARKALPPGATKVETVAIAENPFEIDGRRTIEVTFQYAFFGQPFKTSCVFLSRDAELLRCRVAARAGEFEALRRTFHGSLHSLAGL